MKPFGLSQRLAKNLTSTSPDPDESEVIGARREQNFVTDKTYTDINQKSTFIHTAVAAVQRAIADVLPKNPTTDDIRNICAFVPCQQLEQALRGENTRDGHVFKTALGQARVYFNHTHIAIIPEGLALDPTTVFVDQPEVAA